MLQVVHRCDHIGGVGCITAHPGFEPVALNPYVLQTVFGTYLQLFGEMEETLVNRLVPGRKINVFINNYIFYPPLQHTCAPPIFQRLQTPCISQCCQVVLGVPWPTRKGGHTFMCCDQDQGKSFLNQDHTEVSFPHWIFEYIFIIKKKRMIKKHLYQELHTTQFKKSAIKF